jgi:hypothetical protein
VCQETSYPLTKIVIPLHQFESDAPGITSQGEAGAEVTVEPLKIEEVYRLE